MQGKQSTRRRGDAHPRRGLRAPRGGRAGRTESRSACSQVESGAVAKGKARIKNRPMGLEQSSASRRDQESWSRCLRAVIIASASEMFLSLLGLHANEAGRQSFEELHDLTATKLFS